jgi:hypothetical protein
MKRSGFSVTVTLSNSLILGVSRIHCLMSHIAKFKTTGNYSLELEE